MCRSRSYYPSYTTDGCASTAGDTSAVTYASAAGGGKAYNTGTLSSSAAASSPVSEVGCMGKGKDRKAMVNSGGKGVGKGRKERADILDALILEMSASFSEEELAVEATWKDLKKSCIELMVEQPDRVQSFLARRSHMLRAHDSASSS